VPLLNCRPFRCGSECFDSTPGQFDAPCIAGQTAPTNGRWQTIVDVKSLVRAPKRVTGEATRWRTEPISPRFRFFPKSRPAPPGGVWRSVTSLSNEHKFMLLVQVQEFREDFKAWLAREEGSGWQVLVRLEYHGNHPGLHVHDWCGAAPLLTGARSIGAPNRRPIAPLSTGICCRRYREPVFGGWP
jgi:hypothetical protein